MKLPYFRAPEADDGIGAIRGLMNAILFSVYMFGFVFAIRMIYSLV